MDTATLVDQVICRAGVGLDPNRLGLLIDYRGDHPPLELFEHLRRFGWSTPAPHSPPAWAIDWDNPDVEVGRRWSLRPFLVVGALAVPSGAAAEWATTQDWLESTLVSFGLRLTGEQVEVASLREARQGRVDVTYDDRGAVIDPFGTNPVGSPDAGSSSAPIVPPVPTTGQTAEPTGPTAPSSGALGAPLLWTADDPVMHHKTVSAVIRPGVVGNVFDVLEAAGLADDVVLMDVEGYGRGGGRTISFRGNKNVEPLHRVQVQVAMDPGLVEGLVAVMVEAARLGERGDGKIWVT